MQVKSTKVNIKKTQHNTTFKMQTLKIPPHWALVEKLEEITQEAQNKPYNGFDEELDDYEEDEPSTVDPSISISKKKRKHTTK